jgi:hypothetical protein
MASRGRFVYVQEGRRCGGGCGSREEPTPACVARSLCVDGRRRRSGWLGRLLAESPEIAKSPDSERLIPDLASSHRIAAVRALLAVGLPVDARDGGGATALHWACWKGYADLVKLLLDHGASLTIEDNQFHAPPPGWFDRGLRFCGEGGGDYPRVARLLLAACAALTATGNADVDAILRQYGSIEALGPGEAG